MYAQHKAKQRLDERRLPAFIYFFGVCLCLSSFPFFSVLLINFLRCVLLGLLLLLLLLL